MNKKTNKIGRPKAITSDVLQKLEYGFMKGLTDRQCCDFADIAQQTLYNYCKEHPAFLERKERLKNNPTVKAKINVVEEIENGNIDLSKWYLERKEKKEFSLLIKIASVCGISLSVFYILNKKIVELNDMISGYTELSSLISTMMKGAMITIITAQCSDICSECGSKSIASAIQLAGRIMILILSFPLLEAIIKMAVSFVGG